LPILCFTKDQTNSGQPEPLELFKDMSKKHTESWDKGRGTKIRILWGRERDLRDRNTKMDLEMRPETNSRGSICDKHKGAQ